MTYFRVASFFTHAICERAGNGKKLIERKEEMVAGNKTTNRLHRFANNGTITTLESEACRQ